MKRIKPISFQKENQSSEFLKSRRCNREQLSLQVCMRMTSHIDQFRSSEEENDKLYILLPQQNRNKVLVLMVLQNNLMGVEMLFEIKKKVFMSRYLLIAYLNTFFKIILYMKDPTQLKQQPGPRCYLQYDQMDKVYHFASSCC